MKSACFIVCVSFILALGSTQFFSHRQHVESAGLACDACHDKIGGSPSMDSLPEVDTKTCGQCHEDMKFSDEKPFALKDNSFRIPHKIKGENLKFSHMTPRNRPIAYAV